MEPGASSYEGQKFSSVEEELQYLRGVVAEKEKTATSRGEVIDREAVIAAEIADYKKQDADRVLHESYKMPAHEVDATATKMAEEIVLDLSPEMHDKKIEELLVLLNERGILNVLSVIRAMNNPHIDADFYRFLVEFIKKGYPVQGLKDGTPVYKALHHTLYEVTLPEIKKEEREKALKELLSSMEQFYAGMLSVAESGLGGGGKLEPGIRTGEGNHFTIELAVSEGSEEFIFYVSVPTAKADLFEKQILSIFPNAKITERKDDYNIFNESGIAVASIAKQAKNAIYPIKTYDQFDYDPINIMLNTLSKLEKDGEGAAVQIVFNPAGDYYIKRYKDALDEIQKGTKLKKAIDIRHSFWGEFSKAIKEVGKEVVDDVIKGKKDESDKPKVIDNIAVEQITAKLASPIVEANIRLVASAPSRQRAEHILSDLESSFNQFQNALGNTFQFKRKDAGELQSTLHDYAYRMFSADEVMPLSIKELTSVMHFPVSASGGAPQLKQAKAGTAPAPLGLSKQGIKLGTNKHRNITQDVFFDPADRLRHFYAIGQTGTGKSSLLRNMIIQDIKNGDGVCFIDPHGSDVQDILAHIPPERYNDVIYFDPSYTARPMALNMLEYNRDYPEQKTFVVNELFSIFQKLYGGVPESMGPMFEQYFRNATMLVIEDPDSGCTLLDVSRVMAVKSFRDMKISKCKNPIVVQFWRDIAEKAGGEGSLQNMVPYITSKFDVFLANDIMRPIIAQEKSSFNFREIMDGKKILLVNLAKGRLGDINSSLIGLILVGKILMAALSRVDSFGKDMPPFYLYIDEFQNITTPSISTILSEARKYKLSLNIAHQFINQLDEKIRDAVFGNVGNLAVLRVGSEDAEFLQKQFEPVFTANDIMNIDNMNAYMKMLSDGKPTRPFSIEFMYPQGGNKSIAEKIKELSYLKYGGDKDEVEAAIMEKYKKEPPAPLPPRPGLGAFGL